MSIEKGFINKPDEAAVPGAAGNRATLRGTKRPVAVVAFEIDEDDDPGGDPYNRTGSFCVPAFADE
jgi:hypothetical protein